MSFNIMEGTVREATPDESCLTRIKSWAEGLLLGDSEVSIENLGREIDKLEDKHEGKILKSLFSMIA